MQIMDNKTRQDRWTYRIACADAAGASWTTAGPASIDLPACQSHLWSGRRHAHIDRLPSGGIHHTKIDVLLSSEGMHELQDCQVLWRCKALGLSGTCLGKPLFIQVLAAS